MASLRLMALKDRSATFLLVVALIAGVTIGFAGSTLAYRYKLLRVPGGNMVERMSRSLSLSPSQREAIVEVMEDTRAEVMQLRRSMQRQRRRLMIGAYLKVRAILNPEQQKKFDYEFVPPKFRDEARQAEQRRGDDATQASPSATVTASP
jgi:Spy/CpxP family protein refolding chaperone